MKYKVSEYAKAHNVTMRTVWNWIKKDMITIERTPSGGVLIIDNPHKGLNVATYARVSSSQNKNNLKTQEERLLNYCAAKGYKVKTSISEIGSGLNDKNLKLEKLLLDNSIDIIIVEHKDRLCRFGLNYIEKLLEKNNRKIEIINDVDTNKEDLIEDFISIITSFSARIYGQRRSKRKTEKIINEIINDTDLC